MSDDESKPERLWQSDYGEEWTADNEIDISELDQSYERRFGVSRTSLLRRFFDDLDTSASILEVGANIGTQLLFFKEMGFRHLYGIDIQRTAIEQAHRNRPELDIIEGNLFDIPFKDDFFDVVFTNGVLIHVPPSKINTAVDEIVRCSNNLVYGHEYYADEYTEITHRGHDNILWKADYPSKFLERHNLDIVDIEYLEYKDTENTDVEYLLQQ